MGGRGLEEIGPFVRRMAEQGGKVKPEKINRVISGYNLVDEVVLTIVHDDVIDWLLPGVEATGRRIVIPMCTSVSYNEEGRITSIGIYWDQASVLKQISALPASVFCKANNSETTLPVLGDQIAVKLCDNDSVVNIAYDVEDAEQQAPPDAEFQPVQNDEERAREKREGKKPAEGHRFEVARAAEEAEKKEQEQQTERDASAPASPHVLDRKRKRPEEDGELDESEDRRKRRRLDDHTQEIPAQEAKETLPERGHTGLAIAALNSIPFVTADSAASAYVHVAQDEAAEHAAKAAQQAAKAATQVAGDAYDETAEYVEAGKENVQAAAAAGTGEAKPAATAEYVGAATTAPRVAGNVQGKRGQPGKAKRGAKRAKPVILGSPPLTRSRSQTSRKPLNEGLPSR
ncbi:hypothetical protein HK104_005126 [Borealophlyctis nickersoniae]|nr:hypothetical protein HK104_005126 [Borealophlyctis nickersoniae]